MSARIYVIDNATGAKGSFCIERPSHQWPNTNEYWNPQGWSGSGYVFTDEKLAYAVRDILAGEGVKR
jgi:hypothetical protein